MEKESKQESKRKGKEKATKKKSVDFNWKKARFKVKAAMCFRS